MRGKEVIHGKRDGRKSSQEGSQAKGSVSICQHPSVSRPSPLEPGKQPKQEQGKWEDCRSLGKLLLPAPPGLHRMGEGPVLESKDNTGLVPTLHPELAR